MRDIEELQHRLEAFYQEITPAADSKPWKEIFRRNYKEIVIAFLSTVVLWFFFVHESEPIIKRMSFLCAATIFLRNFP